jgi:heme exporter protein A
MQLSASKLAVSRGGRIIFAGLSFTVSTGECLAVTGPNGAGKSTLLRALAGFLPLCSGAVSLSAAKDHSIAEQAHYVGHTEALKNSLTLSENLYFLAALLDAGLGGLPVSAAIAKMGLAHAAHLPVAYLSAGQRRRAALARLLVARRPLWLLDEPLTALDEAARLLVAQIMTGHLAQGGLIVAATHAGLGLKSRELKLGTIP